MNDAIIDVPRPVNEPIYDYAAGSPEKAALKRELARIAGEEIEIPCIIGGERIATGRFEPVVMPHCHSHQLGRAHMAGPTEVARAIAAAAAAKPAWEAMAWEARAAIFLRAAELLAGKHRMVINAATMLNQAKTCHQAEIDAACELIDFWRYNCAFLQEIYQQQPASAPGTWNMLEQRALEGFVFALTPFNFTSICANLATAPALMGNTVLWKPAETQLLSGYYTYLLLEEAGLPPGVVNFIPGYGPELAPLIIDHPDFAGLNFTGSTDVFRSLWQRTGHNLERYKSFPRLVGETGGKDFIAAHPSADDQALITAIVRGGYEYQGQKCSAVSRVYVARSSWKRIEDDLVGTIDAITMGDVRDFRNFMSAVIKEQAFDRHVAAIAAAGADADAEVIAGGDSDSSHGWFVRPTLIKVADPTYATMQVELFGPIVSLYVYDDDDWPGILDIVDKTSQYGLTGAVFANDRTAIETARVRLRHSAGNFYINDKPTGAVVGQQPFGGARASGTDDKAGAAQNLLRWSAARTIKETFAPPTSYRYPFLDEE